jgi:hypothetical protein
MPVWNQNDLPKGAVGACQLYTTYIRVDVNLLKIVGVDINSQWFVNMLEQP